MNYFPGLTATFAIGQGSQFAGGIGPGRQAVRRDANLSTCWASPGGGTRPGQAGGRERRQSARRARARWSIAAQPRRGAARAQRGRLDSTGFPPTPPRHRWGRPPGAAGQPPASATPGANRPLLLQRGLRPGPLVSTRGLATPRANRHRLLRAELRRCVEHAGTTDPKRLARPRLRATQPRKAFGTQGSDTRPRADDRREEESY